MVILVDIDNDKFWDILFDEACVGGNQAKRIEKELDKIANDGWTPVSDGLPKKKGYYLCQCRGFFRICGFAKNLEKVDKYDFAGEKHAGFYDFDAEFGYCEVHGIIAWRELLPEYKPKKEEKNCDNCANNTDWDEVDRGCYMCCKGLENNYEPKGE